MKYIYLTVGEENNLIFESQVLQLINCFEQQNKSIRLISFKNFLTSKDKLTNKIRLYINETPYNLLNYNIIPIYKLWLFTHSKKIKNIIRNIYKENDKILIICRGHRASAIANKTKEMLSTYDIKVLFDNRGLPLIENQYNNILKRVFKELVDVNLMEYSAENSDFYSFVTNNLANYLFDKTSFDRSKKHFVFPTGINVEEFQMNNRFSDSDRKKVVYIGSLAKWQNINKIVKTFNKMHYLYNNISFDIYTNQTEEAKNLLSSSKHSKSIEINIKYKPHKELLKILPKYDFGVIIRDNTIINKVAAPTKISEYLSVGLKVIYDGEIGVINDLKNKFGKELISDYMININDLSRLDFSKINKRNEVDFENYFSFERLVKKIDKLNFS